MTTQPEALRLADALDIPERRHFAGPFAAAELRRLVAEVEALRADAERYRWLKSQDDWRFRTYPGSMASSRWVSGNSPAEIDAAIDAARSKT